MTTFGGREAGEVWEDACSETAMVCKSVVAGVLVGLGVSTVERSIFKTQGGRQSTVSDPHPVTCQVSTPSLIGEATGAFEVCMGQLSIQIQVYFPLACSSSSFMLISIARAISSSSLSSSSISPVRPSPPSISTSPSFDMAIA